MADLNLNRSFVNGDANVTEDNDTTIAAGHSTAFGEGASGNAVAGDGGIATLGNLTQAGGGSVVAQGSVLGGPVATNPVNSIVAGGGVDHSNAGQGNIGINADGSEGGLANSALNFGSGVAVGGGNTDVSHHTNTVVSHSEDVNLAAEGSSASASQDDNTALFDHSFNTTDITAVDDHSFTQDNSVEQFRATETHIDDSFGHFGD